MLSVPSAQGRNTAGERMEEIITIQQKKEKKKKAPFVAGIIILLLAVVGILSIISLIVGFFGGENSEEAKYGEYADFLTWVVGVDPDSFNDITEANKEDLRNIALSSLMSDNVKSGDYKVTENGLVVPAKVVENYYNKMFGTDNPIVHGDVVGYGYQFVYDKKANVYYVPLSGTTPTFTPQIESAEVSGDIVELRVGYIATGKVEVQADGSVKAVEPDKYADITIKKTDSGYQLISLNIVTMGEHE